MCKGVNVQGCKGVRVGGCKGVRVSRWMDVNM